MRQRLIKIIRVVIFPDNPFEILRTYMRDFQNQPVVCDNSLAETYTKIPEQFVGMRNSIAIILGTIYYIETEFSTAMSYFEDALKRNIQE